MTFLWAGVVLAYVFWFGYEVGLRRCEILRKNSFNKLMDEAYEIGRKEKIRCFLSSPSDVQTLDIIMARVETNIFTDGRDN